MKLLSIELHSDLLIPHMEESELNDLLNKIREAIETCLPIGSVTVTNPIDEPIFYDSSELACPYDLKFSIGMSDDNELELQTYEFPKLGDEVGLTDDSVDLKGTGYRIDDIEEVGYYEYHIKLNPLASPHTIK